MPARTGSPLITASDTGRGTDATGSRSTQDQSPASAVGSGEASRATLAVPTTLLSPPEW